MLMMKALRNRSVRRLWYGQVGSATGDEVYRVAFVWLAVGLIGERTGYLTSLQLFSVLFFGVFGGRWADRWSAYRTMIGVDLVRALITLTPVALHYLHRPSFAALVVSTVLLSGLGAFFEPAMQTVLPAAARDTATLKAANGLMSTTLRLARVTGPAIIGGLSAIVATVHFFTLNSLSYLFSAACVASIRAEIPSAAVPRESEIGRHPLANFLASLRHLRTHPATYAALFAKTICGGAWYLVYGLGIALLAHEISPGDVKSFGLLMGAYGVGNVSSALIVGNLQRRDPERLVYIGLTYLGLCFLALGAVRSFPLLMVAAAFMAFGGPLNDLPFTDLVQSEFPLADLPRVFRLRMIFENLFSLLFMLAGPWLFHALSVRGVIFANGSLIFAIGIHGLIRRARRRACA